MIEINSISWRAIYEQSDQVRRLADRIHNSRMMSPPACDQCIEIAVKQLEEVHARNRSAHKNGVTGPDVLPDVL